MPLLFHGFAAPQALVLHTLRTFMATHVLELGRRTWSFPASLVPPWCLPGCPIGPFLSPWCLPGASQALQLVRIPILDGRRILSKFSTTSMASGPVRGKSWGGPHGRLPVAQAGP